MNSAQKHILLLTIGNLVLVLLFPPYDYVSMLLSDIPTFDGFYFVFSNEPHRIVNRSFLTLEVLVLLANAGIAYLLFGRGQAAPGRPAANRRQRIVAGLVAANLMLALLFPPFETFSAITRATLPTFESFRFVFGDNPMRQIVTPILYIEVALILINGALLWLLFRDKTEAEKEAQRVQDLARQMAKSRKK